MRIGTREPRMDTNRREESPAPDESTNPLATAPHQRLRVESKLIIYKCRTEQCVGKGHFAFIRVHWRSFAVKCLIGTREPRGYPEPDESANPLVTASHQRLRVECKLSIYKCRTEHCVGKGHFAFIRVHWRSFAVKCPIGTREPRMDTNRREESPEPDESTNPLITAPRRLFVGNACLTNIRIHWRLFAVKCLLEFRTPRIDTNRREGSSEPDESTN